MSTFIATLLNSFDIGVLLFVIASGLTIVFGVLGILNFAHGALYMMGAYFLMTLVSQGILPFWIGLLVGPLGVAVVAVVIERLLLRTIYERHIDDAVRLIWGSGYYIIEPPALLTGSVSMFGVTYPIYSFFTIGMGLLIGVGVWQLFNRTRIGKIVRASSLDKEMALAVGINVPMIYTIVFAFGAWLAALGGALAAPMRTLGPSMGDTIIIESFIVVVIGGLGSFPGALLGALILGGIHGFGGRWAAEWNIVLPYVGMAIVLLWRPEGLAGRRKDA
jgi:branched-chain amino acid transport system permease protein